MVLSAWVSPSTIAAYTGTATFRWSADNATHCDYDGSERGTSGSVSVGPYSSSGNKTSYVECWGFGEGAFAGAGATLTVTKAPRPSISASLSQSVLRADVDTFTVTYSARYADYCSYGGSQYPTSGSATLGPYPSGNYSLTFSCTGDGGTSSKTISWKALNPPNPNATVSPSTIDANGTDKVTVSWNSSDASSCNLGGKSGSKEYGPYSYSQAGSKSATVTCTNALGSESDTVSWTVVAPDPTVSASLSSGEIIAHEDTVDLSWSSSNTDSCSHGGQTLGTSGSLTLGPFSAGKRNFTVRCTGKAGSASDTVSLTVKPPPEPAPTVSARVNPTTIAPNTGTATLSWTSTNAASCSHGDKTNLSANGSLTVGPYADEGSRPLTVSCTGSGGSGSATATLTVKRPPEPAPTVSASLDPEVVTPDTGTATLSWTSTNATSCSHGDQTDLNSKGSLTVGPFAKGSHPLTVSCTGAGGTSSAAVTLVSANPPTVSVEATPEKVVAEVETVTLSWTSTDTESCFRGEKTLETSGEETLGPFALGVHDLTVRCEGPAGGASATARVTAAKRDTDGDGIPDDEDPDDDNDGMPDEWEIDKGLDPLVDEAGDDPDDDGDDNLLEYKNKTDPLDHEQPRLFRAVLSSIDSNETPLTWIYDTWRLNITWESKYADVCHLADPPAGAADFGRRAARAFDDIADEIARNEWPPSGDHTFKGGTFDAAEYHQDFYCVGDEGRKESGRIPLRLTVVKWEDSDKDGMPDDWEIEHKLDPRNPRDATADPDGDGDNNLKEFKSGTDPHIHEVAQLLNFRLAKDTIKDNETGELLWASRYADSCHFTDGETIDGRDQGTAGPLTIGVGDFAVGVHVIGMICRGDGGDSAEQTVTLTVEASAKTDTDGDGMPDEWEEEHGFDPLDPSDADENADGDEFTNLEEYDGNSDPNSIWSTPEGLYENSNGFNADYEVLRGLINRDRLPDLLIRNPTAGLIPAVSDFVLIQNRGGGFSLEKATDHSIPPSDELTDIGSTIRLHDLNADGMTDLLLDGLDSHIEEAEDQIVYANSGPDGMYEAPTDHTAVDDEFRAFFRDLSAWLNDEAYFVDNTPTEPYPVILRDEFGEDFEGLEILGWTPVGTIGPAAELSEEIAPPCTGRGRWCGEWESEDDEFASLLSDDVKAQDWEELSGSGFFFGYSFGMGSPWDSSMIAVAQARENDARGQEWYVVYVKNKNSLIPPEEIYIPDFSIFNEDARQVVSILWEITFENGDIRVGSDTAGEIGKIFEDILDAEFMCGILDGSIDLEDCYGVPYPTPPNNGPEVVVDMGTVFIRIGDLLCFVDCSDDDRTTDPDPDPDPVDPNVICEGDCDPPLCEEDGCQPTTVIIDCENGECEPCTGDGCAPVGCDADGNCLSEACEDSSSGGSVSAAALLSADGEEEQNVDKIIKTCLTKLDISRLCERNDGTPAHGDDPRYDKFCRADPEDPNSEELPACSISFLVSDDGEPLANGGTSRINQVPRMPLVVATASLSSEHGIPPDAEIHWWARLRFEPNNKPYCAEVGNHSETFELRLPTSIPFTPSFNVLSGGILEIGASCVAPDLAASSAADHTSQIRGEQPGTDKIFTFMKDISGTKTWGSEQELESKILKNISEHESGARQFDSEGMPLYGAGGAKSDVGVMQICSGRKLPHIWNWDENVRAGRENFRQKEKTFNNRFDDLEARTSVKFNREALKREEMIHRYNAGTAHDGAAYWEWYVNPRTGTGEMRVAAKRGAHADMCATDTVGGKEVPVGVYVALVDKKTTAAEDDSWKHCKCFYEENQNDEECQSDEEK